MIYIYLSKLAYFQNSKKKVHLKIDNCVNIYLKRSEWVKILCRRERIGLRNGGRKEAVKRDITPKVKTISFKPPPCSEEPCKRKCMRKIRRNKTKEAGSEEEVESEEKMPQGEAVEDMTEEDLIAEQKIVICKVVKTDENMVISPKVRRVSTLEDKRMLKAGNREGPCPTLGRGPSPSLGRGPSPTAAEQKVHYSGPSVDVQMPRDALRKKC